MRPLRFLLTLISFVVAFFLLLFIGPWRSSAGEQQIERRGTIGTYFNWRTPSSLFPPSAIISITDDNSTNFVARPAAFGPLLPAKSLSGQLWIGSSFGEDLHPGKGGEGELGCSDVPGWDDGSWKKMLGDGKSTTADTSSSGSGKTKRSSAVEDEDEDQEDDREELPTEDDGTDDYLHHPLPASDGLRANGEAAGNTKKPAHADIQSLQESAEIAGKVVLLKRGGCGFLEKVKWAQRRGGIALIVGDDVRGGQLVTMYARGDTSNVTIPSVFTSYTTAQLLSSLMPSSSLNENLDDTARLGLALGGNSKTDGEVSGSQKKINDDKPNFTTTSPTSKATSAPKKKSKGKSESKSSAKQNSEEQKPPRRSWLASIFGGGRDNGEDSRRPPSSGNVGWVLQDFEDEDEYRQGQIGKHATTSTSLSHTPGSTPRKGPSDGFQIGVQDWRDPDLVAEQKEQQLRGTASISSSSVPVAKTDKAAPTSLKGGSITPGSGEYIKANHELVDLSSSHKASSKDGVTSQQPKDQQDSSRGWIGRLFSSHPGPDTAAEPVVQKPASKAPEQDFHRTKTEYINRQPYADVPQMHEGLWVTLSPTSMSSSPFFDTLLVLVVSPLVTLTVVYALLLLRSRIRRRRWRAPKSVVERLPVRTYQTMASVSSTSPASSISGSPPTATTPLLPAGSRPISTGQRPRARTESEVPLGSGALVDGVSSPSLEQIEEKRAAGLAEWRRRYRGKQKECAVCLEEYVDGVSKVMSLPCGHEFHPECITPWLTTRRRTCPICKGDVVRSLARSSGIGSGSVISPLQQYQEAEEDEDVQEQAVTSVNEDPTSQMPVSRDDEAFEDLERGMAARTPTPDRTR